MALIEFTGKLTVPDVTTKPLLNAGDAFIVNVFEEVDPIVVSRNNDITPAVFTTKPAVNVLMADHVLESDVFKVFCDCWLVNVVISACNAVCLVVKLLTNASYLLSTVLHFVVINPVTVVISDASLFIWDVKLVWKVVNASLIVVITSDAFNALATVDVIWFCNDVYTLS